MVTGQNLHISSENDQTAPLPTAAKAFDLVASSFDSTYENEITARLRSKLYAIIQTLTPSPATVFDINCGTGIDAINLSRQGYRVYGTDISEQMIAAARSKLQSQNLRNVEFSVLSYASLSSITRAPADLVLSNFGGLNCTAELAPLVPGIASITRPGGYFVGVIMPRFSVWEFSAFALRFNWRQALRRFRSHADATGFLNANFPVYYHSPSTVIKAFSRSFAVKKIIGLNIISPNPQSSRFAATHPFLSQALNRLDGFIEEVPVFRSIGDHYIIILRRT